MSVSLRGYELLTKLIPDIGCEVQIKVDVKTYYQASLTGLSCFEANYCSYEPICFLPLVVIFCSLEGLV